MEIYNRVVSGTKNIAATAAVIAADVPCRMVMITAMSDNSGKCWIGGSTVKADHGIELAASGMTPWIPVSNVNLLYVIGTVDDDIGYIAVG